MTIDTIIFAVSAIVAIFGAIMMIGQRNPVASVLYLILSMVAQAVLYIQLSAVFMAAILIIVYAGAILVLFLFVIMLLNLRGTEDLGRHSHPMALSAKVLLAGLFFVEGTFVIKSGFFPEAGATGVMRDIPETFGSVETVAELLFTKYLYPFELTSILLISAIVGAVVLAKRFKEESEPTVDIEQKDETKAEAGG